MAYTSVDMQGQARPWRAGQGCCIFLRSRKRRDREHSHARLGWAQEELGKGRAPLLGWPLGPASWLGSRWPGALFADRSFETHAADWSSCSCVDKERRERLAKRGTELEPEVWALWHGAKEPGLRSSCLVASRFPGKRRASLRILLGLQARPSHVPSVSLTVSLRVCWTPSTLGLPKGVMAPSPAKSPQGTVQRDWAERGGHHGQRS